MAPRRARTRSEVIVRDQIDRLLQILRIVGEVIRTAGTRDRYLLDFQRNMIHPSLRPPRVTIPFYFGDPNIRFNEAPDRAHDRLFVQRRNKPYWINYGNGPLGPFFNVFGSINWPGEMHDVELRNSGWGTIQ